MAPNYKLLTVKGVIVLALGAAVLASVYFLPVNTPMRTVMFFRGFMTDLQNSTSPAVQKFEELPGLEDMLEKTSMPNKTVIITDMNAAWASNNSMIDVFLGSFKDGDGIAHLLNHVLIVTLDQIAYNRCMQVHHRCFRLETEGVDFTSEKFYMSDDYLKMVWRKIDFLRVVLELGYNFLFTDADIMWFRDPFPHLSPDLNVDVQLSCDRFNGNPRDLNNPLNTGFSYVRSNNATVSLYRLWFESRNEHPKLHDQDVLHRVKRTEAFARLGLKVEFLDTLYFGGFCQPSRDFSKVCTMHANCCTSLERKLSDLRLTIDDWRRYKSVTEEEKRNQKFSWRVPRECRKSWT